MTLQADPIPELEGGGWPAEVHLILSAYRAGQARPLDRRGPRRRDYRARAHLRLHSDPPQAPPWLLYSRDVDARGMGFLSPHRLPLGYGGTLEIALPDGRPARIACTLLRCREAVRGWYEGALYFNRAQMDFEE